MSVDGHIRLDRIELEEVGANPERAAAEIHRQLGDRPGPVDVYRIASALDIEEVREEALRGMEAALVTTAERGYGRIVVNASSSQRRRRFSVGHELGHYLNPHHRPTAGRERFECSRDDMRFRGAKDQSRHQTQELEANRFAVELLMPRGRLRPFVKGRPDLCRVLAISDELDVSREAAARRYVRLHDACLAVVFSQDGRLTYPDRGDAFPHLCLRRGQPLPELQPPLPGRAHSSMQDVEAADWLERPRDVRLRAQSLHQQNGIATTLLWAEVEDEADGEPSEDAFDRIGSWQRAR